MKGITQCFYGTSEEWQAQVNPLYKGVWGVEVKTDGSRVIKMGDGVRTWPQLPTLLDEDTQLGDLTALIDQTGAYLSQVQTMQAQLQTLQDQIAQAQETLAGQVQQFENDKAALEQEIADAGLVDDVSVHRDEEGNLYSSGTAPVHSGNLTSDMGNAPEDNGAHMFMTDADREIGAGFGVNTDGGFVAGAAYIKSSAAPNNNTRLLLAVTADGKNRMYLLKDKAFPESAEELEPGDELLNKAEIQALIDQAQGGE
jgi:hypothetical protein